MWWIMLVIMIVLVAATTAAISGALAVGAAYLVITFIIEPFVLTDSGLSWALRVIPGPFDTYWGNAWLWAAGILAVFALPKATLHVCRHTRQSLADQRRAANPKDGR